jgi:hypothetical protein
MGRGDVEAVTRPGAAAVLQRWWRSGSSRWHRFDPAAGGKEEEVRRMGKSTQERSGMELTEGNRSVMMVASNPVRTVVL